LDAERKAWIEPCVYRGDPRQPRFILAGVEWWLKGPDSGTDADLSDLINLLAGTGINQRPRQSIQSRPLRDRDQFIITKAASRMTQQTTFMNSLMNSPSAKDRAHPLSGLNSGFAALAERIMAEIGDCGPRIAGLRIVMAGHRAVAALTSKGRALQSAAVTLASEPLAAPTRSTGANETLARFQREIVPQLDAAYNFARFLSRDADAAQDIVQEAFLRAYRGFDGYHGGDARAWIFAIVRNCYHNWLLDRRRKAALEVDVHGKNDADDNAIDNVASDEDSPETTLLRRAESGAVRLVLNRLPRPLREILVLRELEGLSYRQIADIAALPIGTVMSRLARARTRFESAWRQENQEENEQQGRDENRSAHHQEKAT
jgi:RNA polymerase sigma factor (sigma-70 family)